MTYHRSFDTAYEKTLMTPYGKHCFCCGEPASGPTVVYEGMPDSDGKLKAVFMHRDCAFAMAQRLIIDAWPNRTHETLMSLQGT